MASIRPRCEAVIEGGFPCRRAQWDETENPYCGAHQNWALKVGRECAYCHGPIPLTFRINRIYCSAACAQKQYDDQPADLGECTECGSPFPQTRKQKLYGKKFCDDDCYSDNARRRRLETLRRENDEQTN